MKVGDLIKFKKHGTLGIVIQIWEASQVDDSCFDVIWVDNGKRGTVWWNEADLISRCE